jgi:predicted nuclease with TOPRIM domain
MLAQYFIMKNSDIHIDFVSSANKLNQFNKEHTKLKSKSIEKSLEKKIDSINKNNDEIKKECTKMGSHIDFIEDTYTTLQMPLNYLKKSVERLTGANSGTKELPIKNKDSDEE